MTPNNNNISSQVFPYLDFKLADECKVMHENKNDCTVYLVELKVCFKSSTVIDIRANSSIKRMIINGKSNLKPQKS